MVYTVFQYHRTGFADKSLYTTLFRRRDKNMKNSMTKNNRYMDFVQTRCLILFVSDNANDS